MIHPSDSDYNKDNTSPRAEHQPVQRSKKDRRKGWGTLVYYLSGGSENRLADRRNTNSDIEDSDLAPLDNRKRKERRQHKIHVGSLYTANIYERRVGARRKKDQRD